MTTLLSEDTFIIRTPDDMPYRQAWIIEDKHYIEFTLKGCSNQMVYLGESVFESTDRNGILITYGANGNSETIITRYKYSLLSI